MKEIKLIDIVKELSSLGHEVQYTLRQDGSLRISKLDGVAYSGSKGNARAREIVGATLSVKRTIQLSKIATPKGKWGHKKQKPLPEEVKKAIRRAQRIWRKQGKNQGRISTKNVRWTYENYGLQETLRRLNQSERYSTGLAYVENVDWIIARLKGDIKKNKNSAVEDIIELLDIRKLDIREEWIYEIYKIIYDWEKSVISAEEMKRRIKETIKETN